MAERLTDNQLRNLAPPVSGNKVYYDAPNKRGNDWTPGFGLRVTAAGARSFILNYRTKDGVERRKTIGAYGTWTLLAARAEAKRLKRAIDQGADPVAEGRERLNALTVRDLCKRFLEEHVVKKRPATQRDYKSMIKIIEADLGNRKVASIEYADIDRLHRRITASGSPFRANRTVTVASKMFTLAIRWKMGRADNPCKGVERNVEEKRKRYLSPDELARLIEALDKHPNQQAADAFRLLLLTGARSGEVFAALWDQFDLDTGKWLKPGMTTKQRTEHEVPLSAPARQLLQRIRCQQDEAEKYVFPSNGKTGHITTLKKSWREVCRAAKITGLRVHDLRHSFASQLVSSGASLPLIGALLGHSNPMTTSRYSHLFDDPQRAAVERVGAIVTGKKKAPVVPLRRR
jgi:integrase